MDKHPYNIISLNNLAILYSDMGDHKAALPLYRQALAIYKETLGERHPTYAKSLNNLAFLYKDMGDNKAALPLLQQALAIRKEELGDKHPYNIISLNNLAALYHDMGDNKTALPLLQQALAIHKAALREKHPSYATSLDNLGVLYKAMGDDKAALLLFHQALELRKEVLGDKHPSYATSLDNLARLYQGMRHQSAALPLAWQSLALARQQIDLTAAVQSERQQLAGANAVRYRLDHFLSYCADMPEMGPAAHTEVLAWKGAVFARQLHQRQFARLMHQDGKPEVKALLEQLEQASRRLVFLTFSAPPSTPDALRKHRDEMRQLTKDKEDLEIRLSGLSDEFRKQRRQPGPRALADALPRDAALVDFLFYGHYDPRQKEPNQHFQRRLVAFVLRAGGRSVRVDLGEAAAIEDDVAAWLQVVVAGKRSPGPAGDRLRKRLWEPLLPHLGDAKVVLLSPDGALAKLPFAALPGSKPGSYLIEELALAVLPVPRLLPDLLEPKKTRLKPSLLVVGDVTYDPTDAVVASAAADDRGGPRSSGASWNRLDATRIEALAVKDSFGNLFSDGTVTDLAKAKARKAAVREHLQKSRYAHLATHGFFDETTKSALDAGEAREQMFGSEGVTGWHPLLLSGIVLAGANREPGPGEEDGILRALEVSEMDLSRLELAVLSACETGLGRQARGEGVLGLQRAFQVAGCRSVVASLWKVDDTATQQLMASFYKVCWDPDPKKIVPRAEALRQAQLQMLCEGKKRGMVFKGDKADENDPRLPPFYWAAFVLSGDWR